MILLLVSPSIGVDALMSTAFSGVRNQANCYRAAAISPAESDIRSEKKGSIDNFIVSRRDGLLRQGAIIFGIFSGTDLVNALDIDAFMNSEVSVKLPPRCCSLSNSQQRCLIF
jgi:hypothetical protein